jgi:hypothetical protein
MKNDMFFKINKPNVVYERFDGETVIVDFNSGSYYSLTDVADEIWTLIEQEMGLEQMSLFVSSHYDADSENIQKCLDKFLNELKKENLIVENNSQRLKEMPEADKKENGKKVFKEPVLNKYDDMQEMLLLDPIHDVDETGWPNKSSGD